MTKEVREPHTVSGLLHRDYPSYTRTPTDQPVHRLVAAMDEFSNVRWFVIPADAWKVIPLDDFTKGQR